MWAADGKPYFSRTFQGRLRALKVLIVITTPIWCIMTFDRVREGEADREHVFSQIRQPVLQWWNAFASFDRYEVAKATSVGGSLPKPDSAQAHTASPRSFKQPEI